MEAANQFLEQEFLPVLNGKFTVEARSPVVDGHRRAAGNLAEVLSWEEHRVVAKDWTVAWNGQWFPIGPCSHLMRTRTALERIA